MRKPSTSELNTLTSMLNRNSLICTHTATHTHTHISESFVNTKYISSYTRSPVVNSFTLRPAQLLNANVFTMCSVSGVSQRAFQYGGSKIARAWQSTLISISVIFFFLLYLAYVFVCNVYVCVSVCSYEYLVLHRICMTKRVH